MKKLTLLLLVCTACFMRAQTKAEVAIQQYEEKFPQEKISIILDKDRYISGDQIWFKAFVFDGNTRSEISTSLFVELYDANKKLVTKKLLPLYKGEGKGNLKLAEDLKENIYYLRAYTSWISNFSEDFIYVKQIAVYNPSSEEKLVKNPVSNWSATVHPESGSFIDGVETKMAVRLHTNGGSPKSWKGTVVDSEKPEVAIASFQGLDENVGFLSMTPQKGKKYQVIVQDNLGKQSMIDLPVVQEKGIYLKVISNDSAIKYQLIGSSGNIDLKNYKIIGTINNRLVYKAVHKKTGRDSYSIPTQQLINGILQLTVFNENEKVIASRLCFVKPNNLEVQKPNLQSIKKSNQPRSLNQFEFAPQTNYSSYTVLVQDIADENIQVSHNLLSDLWLTNDLTSVIKSPAQYFSKNRSTEALDALLISERWKRFDWKNIITGNYPFIKHKPEPYLSYTGSLTINQSPAPNTEFNLAYRNENSDLKIIPVKTDNSGNFAMQNMIFDDTYKFYYQLNGAKNTNNVKVFAKSNLSAIPYLNTLPTSEYRLEPRSKDEEADPEIAQYVVAKKIQKNFDQKINEIEEVKLKAKKKDKTKVLNKELSSSMFQSADEIVFDFVNDNMSAMGSPDILQWLNGRVAGLEIRREMGQSVAYIRGSRATIFLDEMRAEPSMLNGISVNDIAMIKVFKGISAVRSGSSVAIYTKRGGSSNEKDGTKSGMNEIVLNGFDKELAYNNIDYKNTNPSDIPTDLRKLLYWNPNVATKDKQDAIIQFYNNDSPKKQKVTIISLDDDSVHIPLYYSEILP
ncbi:TonB-dependent receptor plug domain-containing protein [Chryseobacterium sp. FH1]|uniref:TonB-dependent receptor plug domain-containing protein n=1 Tax=Chryseobacterium sp. FH1 TaxID=1233951 RepID=UPI0004E29A49|nr:TonB-dependent receptor plug domain-containing protein [Chryseobacterium sp. FH1]KFC18430.1 hypothetical protein IO90_18145 [Chryseobacterium sp. FH1]